MRYLRMLSNSLIAAALATSYVLALVMQMNPSLPLSPARVEPLAAAIGFFYIVNFTAIAYVMLVAVQLLAREPFSPGWISVNVLAWLAAASSAGGAVLMWANLQRFTLVLEPSVASRMTAGAIALACAAALFVIVGLARRYAGPGRAVVGLSWLLVALGSIAAPFALRGRGTLPPLESHPLSASLDVPAPERSARLTMLAVDAGSFEVIANATAEGRLPNFGRMLDSGAAMHLATIHPTSAEAVWAAVATGKLPQKNGVRAAGTYRIVSGGDAVQVLPEFCFATSLVRLGFLADEPLTSAAIRTRTLWSILSTQGVSVGVVNWPLTYPAPVVRGYLVSDAYSRLALAPAGIDDPQLVYPPDIRADARQFVADTTDALRASPLSATDAAIDERRRAAGRLDRVNERLAAKLAAGAPPQVQVTRYQSLDTIGHYFLRYAMPSAFGDVTDDERRTLGPVLEAHYALIDEAIGRAMASLGPDDLLLVVSGFGMEPLSLARRGIERFMGDPDVSGTHDNTPDGFLLAYGGPVAKARSLRRASVVDVLPTILYFLGLPIGRDMDGFARADIFQPAFTGERPLTFIPTYDR
ncbi:MAG TPA: alkaline phosphatase family protein [Vicinamibacterales bacterium]|jgi:predicted AlkP superfamily phosphohydrolase/phosphomutase|nr:alkaline phosphatase family protein [Vicinamibacterales bacterium]